MLVWLASYPRSGITLLRQVLKGCFDLTSCEGLERLPANFLTPDGVRDKYYGSYFVQGDPEEFYRHARATAELVCVKSHQLPRDDAKAIYVVRDGRLALKSFTTFQDTYHPGASTFDDLLIGKHAYGEWTSHYHAWAERPGQTLVLRFEELVRADNALLNRIAAFLGLPGPVRPWVNPQAQLRELDPSFFGTGNRTWTPDAFWTPARLRSFYTLHGPLMIELGYASAAEVAAGAHPVGSDAEHFVHLAHRLAAHGRELQQVCDERGRALEQTQRVCDGQAAEIAGLARECTERLAKLETSVRAGERLRKQVAELDALAQAANERVAELDDRYRTAERQLRMRQPIYRRVLQRFRRLLPLLPR